MYKPNTQIYDATILVRRYAMNVFSRTVVVLAMVVSTLIGVAPSFGKPTADPTAPDFSLTDLQGTAHRLSDYGSNPMLVLYFFDATSRPSQEGLLSLNKLAKRFDTAGMAVWGITRASREVATEFTEQANLNFPVLLDTSDVSNLYNARLILPTVCILGPGLKVLDTFQGGGKTTEVMLVRLAERTLQRKETMIAKAISDTIIEKNPENIEAKSVKGYAEIKEGNLAKAEKIFQTISKDKGSGEFAGKEGLSAVYARTGDTEKALKLADEVVQKAPERTYAHVVKADILYSQNKKQEAEAEYRKAIESKTAQPYQKAVALNQFGRFFASVGNYEEARTLYDQAVDVDPYYIEAMSNKGMTYEKEGNWDKALSEYRQVLSLNEADTFASVLAQKAEEMIAIQKDAIKSKEIDTLVKDLAKRFRKQKKSRKRSARHLDITSHGTLVCGFPGKRGACGTGRLRQGIDHPVGRRAQCIGPSEGGGKSCNGSAPFGTQPRLFGAGGSGNRLETGAGAGGKTHGHRHASVYTQQYPSQSPANRYRNVCYPQSCYQGG